MSAEADDGPLRCDNCQRPTYPDWRRCIHCAHYFCSACEMRSEHGCGVKFKSDEQEAGKIFDRSTIGVTEVNS